MRKRNVGLVLLVAIWLAAAWGEPVMAVDRSEQYLLTVKTYIISGSAGAAGISFPLFPYMSMAVLEETISDVETFYDKLKSLYAFSDYRLLDLSSVRVRMKGYQESVVEQVYDEPAKRSGVWEVNLGDFAWDQDGRLQMLIKILREEESFLESHLSVLPGRSVILGRFADGEMEEAVFAVIVPVIEVAAIPKKAAVEAVYSASADRVRVVRKTGLPPPEPGPPTPVFPCPESEGDQKAPIPPAMQLPEAVQMPEIVEMHPPKYPASALRDSVEGKVWLRSLISEEGKVLEICVLRSSGRDDFDRAAVEAGRKYIFLPGRDAEGKPVEVWVVFQVVFALE